MIGEATIERWMREANPIPTLDDVDADEFARFVAAAHTRRATDMQAPTQHPTPVAPVTTPPRRRRKAWAFATAFILVVAAIGTAALVTRDSGEAPVADEPMAPVTVTTPPSTTSSPTPIDVEALTWSRVPHDEAVFNPKGTAVMWDVTVGGPGLVAVGRVSGDETTPAVWVSGDGITWSLLSEDEASLDGWMMFGVTAGGPGLVAVGIEFDPPGSDAVVGGTVWTSEDGISWSKEATVEGGAATTIFDVTVGGPGLVAVGNVRGDDSAGAAVWTSVDGVTWTRVPHDPEVFGDAGFESDWLMESVTVGGPGLVAIGNAEGATAVWTSPDGLTWTLVPAADIPGAGAINDIVAGGPGLVAVGRTPSFSAAVWTSPDGLTWTLVPPSELPDGVPLHSVISVGSQLIAIGGAPFGSEVWTSVDGVTWTTAEISGVVGEINSVAATGDGLIAVGNAGGAAVVWIATEG